MNGLLNHPLILDAKKLLREALSVHQKTLNGIRPAKESLKKEYATMIQALSEYRGIPLFYPYISSGLGQGPLVELVDGSVKYDLISGIGVHWGHAIPEIIDACVEAALCDTVMQGNLQQHQGSVPLYQQLLTHSGMDHCYLTTSGGMAVENGLKIIFQKKYPVSRVLAFERCFMGRTLALAQVTDKAEYREGLPDTLLVDYVPFYDATQHEKSIQQSTDRLNALLDKNDYAVMCFELIQGEGGCYPGHGDFFKALMTILKKRNIAILVDEIQTFGRTPSLFAYQHFGVEEFVDVVTVGKLLQVCATLFRDELSPKPGLVSQTFTSSSAAIATALYILEQLTQGNFLGPDGKIAATHQTFLTHFHRLEKKHPDLLSGPYGLGSMIAFTPFQGDKAKVLRFLHHLFEAGVIAFLSGKTPTRVRFLPPVACLSESDIDTIMKIVEESLLAIAGTPTDAPK